MKILASNLSEIDNSSQQKVPLIYQDKPKKKLNQKALLASLIIVSMTTFDSAIAPNSALAAATSTVKTSSISRLNPANLTYLKQSTVLNIFGTPGPKHFRGKGKPSCGRVTNSKLSAELVTEDVGPFKVTGLKKATAAYKRIFAKVKREKPSLYRQLGTAGSLCQRVIGGSNSYSNHAWGTAIDIKINGQLDAWGDGRTMIGLKELAPYFHEEGFYWGAGFSKEDSMHFEPSDRLMQQWYGKGSSPSPVATPKPTCKGASPVLKPNSKSLKFKRGKSWQACGYKFAFQVDGNLVLYRNKKPIWATGSHTMDAQLFAVQTDGNIVLYNGSGKALWATNTSGNPGAFLVIQTDGNVVVYDRTGSRPLYSTKTQGGTPRSSVAASQWQR